MLQRINRMSVPGVFESFRWEAALPDFRRINVIFGPNGSGKSSFCRFLAAVASETPSTLSAGEFAIQVNDGESVSECVSTDDLMLRRLHVFNEEYVERSHRLRDASPHMPAVLTLGERDATAEDRLEQLTGEVTAAESLLQVAKLAAVGATKRLEEAYRHVSTSVVDDAAGAGDKYSSRGSYNAGVVKKAYAGSRDRWAELLPGVLTAAKQVVASDRPDPLDVVSYSFNLGGGLSGRCAAVLAATPVSIVLDTLKEHPDATGWVDSGRSLHADSSTCIFCGQGLPPHRLESIEDHFSDAVDSLKAEIQSLVELLSSALEGVRDAEIAIPRKAQLRTDLRADFDVAHEAWIEQRRVFRQWCEDLIDRLEKKVANVLASVPSQVDVPPSLDGSALENLRDTHNTEVDSHSDSVRAAAESIEFHHLKSRESVVETESENLAAAELDIKRHGETLQALREEEIVLRQVDGDPKPSAENLTRNVAQLLGRHELSFRVIDGGRYAVLRGEHPAAGLSTGERTAISLVHFLEGIARADRAGGHPIVVIDDPISSLDSNVFHGVSTLIWSEMVTKEHAAQLFLFTHNFELFRQWDIQLEGVRRGKLLAKFPSAMYELKSTHRAGLGGPVRRARFAVWPPSEKHRKRVRSAYHHGFIAVSDAYLALKHDDSIESRLDAQLLFPNVIRRVLETFLAFKNPESASDFGTLMRDASKLLERAGYDGDADALRTRLTRYAHAYSHAESPETTRVVEPDEIMGAMQATFEFMHALDPDHFSGLCEVIDRDPTDLLPNRASATFDDVL